MALETATARVERYLPFGPGMGEEKWIDVDGIRTRYFDEGHGEPIVMIHGVQMGSTSGASSARTWELNLPVLARHHNAIAFDKLGQGYTDLPKSDADYTMHAIVQHAIGLLDRLGKKPYHLVGHSRGGYIVTRIAMERPDLVKTLVPVSSGTLSPGQTRTHLVHKNQPEPRLSRESIRWYAERYSYNPKIVTEEWLDGSYAIASSEKNKIAVRKMTDEGLMKKQFLPQMVRQTAEVHRFLLTKGVHCPTLIVWGWNDPAALVANGLQLIELFMKHQRETEVRFFNWSGHFVMREQAAAFNRMLDAFVKAHSKAD
ncbi:MAG TPA: alpha/beta hydrolase [Beijerinckiaceae bacterium]|nr:alpha/beta hydrolase [Beijerinckiaceae bacterium]